MPGPGVPGAKLASAATDPLVPDPTGLLNEQPRLPLVGGEFGDDVVLSVDEFTNRLLVLASPQVTPGCSESR